MSRNVWRIFRTICYVALVFAVLAVASLTLPFALDYCRDGGSGQMVCDALVFRYVFEFGFAVVMFGAFTGVPAVLALAGIAFLAHDLWSGWRAD